MNLEELCERLRRQNVRRAAAGLPSLVVKLYDDMSWSLISACGQDVVNADRGFDRLAASLRAEVDDGTHSLDEAINLQEQALAALKAQRGRR